MAAKVLTFHMTYEGLADRIWRDVEVSSNSRLDQLGYAVLATFDTMACHLFQIEFREHIYAIFDPDNPTEYYDLDEYTLGDLALKAGDQMTMLYDFGTEQTFRLTVMAIRDMKRGEGRRFPYVSAMNGRGIIDDMPMEELAKLIRQIDRNGCTDKPVYYSCDGIDDPDFLPAPWDIRHFDLKTENTLLKYRIEAIAEGYAPFWEDKQLMKHPIVIHNGVIKNRPSPKQETALSNDELCRAFFEAVLRQEPQKLRGFFRKDAVIDWPCTDERFTLDEYIRANCEYPGAWDGEICSILPAEGQTVLITRVWPRDKSASFHCVSVIQWRSNKIASLTEYWSDDGPAPKWRRDMRIGRPIDGKG